MLTLFGSILSSNISIIRLERYLEGSLLSHYLSGAKLQESFEINYLPSLNNNSPGDSLNRASAGSVERAAEILWDLRIAEVLDQDMGIVDNKVQVFRMLSVFPPLSPDWTIVYSQKTQIPVKMTSILATTSIPEYPDW